jgi:cobyric acid synthase
MVVADTPESIMSGNMHEPSLKSEKRQDYKALGASGGWQMLTMPIANAIPRAAARARQSQSQS